MADNASPIILLTRPRVQSERFAAQIAARYGSQVDVALHPLVDICPLDVGLALEGVSALVFTSENGVLAYAALTARRDIPAFCVGRTTARSAREMGMIAHDANGALQDLVALILKTVPQQARVLHLHGRHQAGNLASALRAQGWDADDLTIYDQRARAPNAAFYHLVRGETPLVVPLFSPRSAQLFFAALPEDAAPKLRMIAISQACFQAIPALYQPHARVLDTPNADAMLQALGTVL
ncbi:uroporphyrinogen-III synthase [Rhodobacteraceae bacterium XHP0102]|nr:uroporphyrinogen-III synthase [Rhodobacteraceae bacterium XHP0102]